MRPGRLTVVLLVLTSACTQARPTQQGAAEAVIRATEEYLAASDSAFVASPHEFARATAAARERWWTREDAFVARVAAIDTARLDGPGERVLLAVLRERLEASIGSRVCRSHLWRVDPSGGWHVHAMPRDAREQPVGTPEAREAALRRWRSFPRFVDGEIADLREGVRTGYVAPRAAVQRVIAQLDASLAAGPEASPWWDPARRDSAAVFRAAFDGVVRDAVLPALRRYREFLAREYIPHARSTVGLVGLPDGDRCWRAEIRRATTLPITPEQLDSLGRALQARAAPERDRLARERYGLADGRALSARLESDPALAFGSRGEAMDTVRALLSRTAALLPRYFGRLPEPLLPEVDTATLASGLPGFYREATASGRRARVTLNPRDFTRPPARMLLRPVLLHESVPGHHLQAAVARRDSRAHRLLERLGWNLAFGEGWATYAASELAREMGVGGGAWAEAEALEGEVNQAVDILVADGLHRRGWSVEQALDTLRAYSGADPDVLREGVDFMVSRPADNLAYSLGALELGRLRRDAERALGARFDVRAFHDVVLEDGQVPLAVLRSKVARWIVARNADGR